MSFRHPILGFLALFLALAAVADAAPFDVWYRPSDKANWTFYGGRDTRGAADAAAAELKSAGFDTKVSALGDPRPAATVGPVEREAIAVGGRGYVRRPGLGYTPGWYGHRGGWGGWNGWGGGWGGAGFGGGWGGGYGGYGGSSSHSHHSSHHHSHSHHSSHHVGSHATPHPSHSAAHAGGRGGAAHRSSSHHSHTHSHSHAHHAHAHHGGHHR